ncbi:GntR family transcriptional regulator [Thioclava dalianensis]|uniref:GntR family transcriptional regulator n=1 Tax=Thioclava dalianensis TaxID=1185766 RepID=A0A074THJ4_9RHOB|nr:phosphonate metabolism transcriptional regulator PhnF [Thioclava dalianensis]KEP71166.1 GntR family transcriptional regulator [Thioclava dalianensis]SFN23583.1 GntR family transcriptional regulator, phosphonate transport system regulatory protein [Thioclava dalianensis]
MTRPTPIWCQIADTLRHELTTGLYPSGAKLPTEAQLSARFGVNRHTVRRALATLADEGCVVARRGAGVFVADAPPADYPISRRVRFQRNIAASGRTPSREVLRIETRLAAPEEAAALDLPAQAQVHVFEGISLADAVPLAHFRSIFPAERFPTLPVALTRHGSVTAALREAGLPDYLRLTTRIAATRASGTRAGLLRLPEGAPLLRTEAINADADGQPIEFGISWFAGERVTLTIGSDDEDDAPATP